MANDLAGNPWVLDTAAPGTLVFDGWVMPRSVRWDAPLAGAGSRVILKDRSGRVVWSSSADAANFGDAQTIATKTGWDGLIVDTLATGNVLIEV